MAAEQLAIPESTLRGWVKKAHESGGFLSKSNIKPVNDMSAENSKLKRELAKSSMERDILKKAMAFFAKESMQGTRS